jgi:hypothetical protein
MEDAKVKVSEDDTTNGYLFDKIETGDCIRKVITKDYLGAEKLKLELDFPCIESRLNCCGGNNTSISIQGTNTVCGNNTTLLTAVTNCTSTVQWSNGLTGPTIQASAGVYYATCGGRQSNTITVTSTGNCGCIPIWRDIVPVEIYCGQVLNRDNCKKYIKQSNQCNNDIQWVEYTGSGADGSGCPGCAPTNFIATRSQTFVRQNCPTGCTPGSVTFGKNYYSTVSQAVADTLATNDNNFLTEGQNYANATGSCTNCGTPTPQPLPTPLPVPIPVVIPVPQPLPPLPVVIPVPSPLPTPIPLPVEPPIAPPVGLNSYELYFCGTTTLTTLRIPIVNGLDTGMVIKASNGVCYTVATLSTELNTGLTVTGQYNNCEECNPSPQPVPQPVPVPVQMVWNLQLCSDGSNASFQVDNNNLSSGIVLKDNDSGLCYYTVNQGPQVYALLTNYYEESSCASCTSVPTPVPVPVPVNTSRSILLSSPTTSSSEDACLISSGSTKYISNTVAISNGLEIFNDSALTTKTYNTNPGNWSTIIDGGSKYAVQFDSSGVVSVIISCNTVPTPVTPTPITPTPVPVTPIPPSVTYYELSGCADSLLSFTTIEPDGLNQRYINPTAPTVFYIYTGSSVSQTTAPPTLNGSLQKTTQYNCS